MRKKKVSLDQLYAASKMLHATEKKPTIEPDKTMDVHVPDLSAHEHAPEIRCVAGLFLTALLPPSAVKSAVEAQLFVDILTVNDKWKKDPALDASNKEPTSSAQETAWRTENGEEP